MSALLRPPKSQQEQRHGRPNTHARGGRGRGRGRGRGGRTQEQPPGPRQSHGETIKTGCIVNFGDGSTRRCRFQWPVSVSEQQGIANVLKELSNSDHQEVSEIHISQAPRGTLRIDWLDDEPYGNYYFNQHLYGENGTMNNSAAGYGNLDLDYNPDDVGYNQETLAGYQQEPQGGFGRTDPRMMTGGMGRPQPQGLGERAGPGPRYNPDDIWGQQGPPAHPGQYGQAQTQGHPAFLQPRH
jgi:hypothetical protein